ncbi:MAG TPA: hypothetical protein VHF92_13395 [Geodermatophilus sp.]|nr:hypothetical protein [Geodermatophilus sp.]
MGTRTAYRGVSGLLAGALLLMPLAACGDTAGTGDADATATETTPADETGETTEPTDAGDTAGGGTGADVDCTGNSCSVTLSGDGAEADILGTTIVLGGVENGQATFRVGDQDLTCGEGDTTEAGPLTLECTTVQEDTVTLTATLG